MSCSCTDLPVVKYQIPGPQGSTGDDGTNGTDGVDSFTDTTAQFIMPDTGVGDSVTIEVGNSDWATVGHPSLLKLQEHSGF